jgi:hypothetical protein
MILYDEKEVEKVKRLAESAGFARAERLLYAILDGERNIRVGVGGDDRHSGPPKTLSLLDSEYKHSPWGKLVKALDKGSK